MERRSPIPREALERHLAILATSGAGKTVAAKGAVEDALEAGERVCIIDPIGVWHGLRTFANGKKAFPVVIFGRPDPRGDRPYDVEIDGNCGVELARLVATSSFPSIICTAGMSIGARTRFFADFAEAIIDENNQPLLLVIDECHLFMPQGRVQDPQSARMLHAANNLVSGGRSRGFAIMLISQRASKVHKDSLTQVKAVVAMQNVHALDCNAVEDWIKGPAGKAQAQEIRDSLPVLQTGEGWIYVPTMRVLERVKFPMIRTLDTSDRPKPGEKRALPSRLEDIDLGALKAALSPPPQEDDATHVSMSSGRTSPKHGQKPAAKVETRFTQEELNAHGEQRYRDGFLAGRRVERADWKRVINAGANALPPLVDGQSVAGYIEAAPADARATLLAGLEPLAQRMLGALERTPSGLTPKQLSQAIKVKPGSGRWYRNLNALKTSGLAVERGAKLVAPHAQSKGAGNG